MRQIVLAVAVLFLLAGGWVSDASDAYAHGLIASRAVGPTPRDSRPAPREPLVLGLHKVDATIDGPVASVQVEQVFRNRSELTLEGDYLFPLPEGAAVSRFAMTMGGRMVEGEVMDAEKARAVYESIVRRQRDPGLLEYVGRGLFRARVFPILPKKDVRIQLSFQQILPEDGATLELRYPLATDRVHGSPVEDTVISVHIKSDIDVKAVYSPSHPVAVVRKSDREVEASFEQSNHRQDRDFLLYVGRSEDRIGGSVLSHRAVGEDGTFLAVFAPSVSRDDIAPVPKDVLFVLDTSGSMREHDKLGQAKRALSYGVNVLRPEDRFNIVAFSSQARPFREELQPVTGVTKSAAASWIGSLKAAGGTNIEAALTTALPMGTEERLFLVVFLTDGRPTLGEVYAKRLVEIVEANNTAKARVFTFGVGYDLEVDLLDQIAEATGGARDYVMPKDEMEIVTSRFFRKVTEPVLTDVTVDFGGVVHDVYPSKLPDLFAGGQITVMGRYAESGARTLRLRGKVGETEVEYVWPATFQDGERADYLPRLWAGRKVAFLLDAIRLHGAEPELVDEVKRLATRYAIVTPYTSGLVVEDSELEGRDLPRFAARAPERARVRTGGGGGGRGQFRGPGDSVPPGLREPSDPTPPPAPPPSGPPPTTPTPVVPTPATPGSGGGPGGAPVPDSEPNQDPKAGAIERSKELDHAKKAAVEQPSKTVRQVEGKTFVWKRDGSWVDTAWTDEMAAQDVTEVAFLSEAWTKLAALDEKVAKFLALGEHVVFVWEGKAYRVVPAE